VGIYDRDYYRDDRPGLSLGAPRSAVVTLIVINIAVYLVDQLFYPVAGLFALHASSVTHPWLWWQLVTYGFAHAAEPAHVLFNMLALWFFGRDIEEVYGRREFAWLYVTLLVLAGLAWSLMRIVQGLGAGPPLVGASGAVAGVIILFVLHFPHRTVLLFFVLPVPAWVLGVMAITFDILGFTGSAGSSNVAYAAHLTGAAVAALYYQQRWRLSGWTGRLSLPRLRRPRLRVHDPDAEEQRLNAEVDRILEKISRSGEGSLSRKERRTLETASRQYQRRRRDPE